MIKDFTTKLFAAISKGLPETNEYGVVNFLEIDDEKQSVRGAYWKFDERKEINFVIEFPGATWPDVEVVLQAVTDVVRGNTTGKYPWSRL